LIKEENLIVDITIDDSVLSDINNLDEFIKLGKSAKAILYILLQIKKSSLQFLADLLDKSTRNVYAILQRLEEKDLVYSYNSKIYHLNTRGRRFSPKYYVITDLGKIVAKIKPGNTDEQKKINTLLEKTKTEMESMHKIFNTTKT
jgi:predicted transcriptional regulator